MNRLADETSPYLRQHRDNPVDWYPWGADAFAAAEERNVPILLSVGYSACHWCHVMAHECFEDDEVAARMNDLFVNVKVDREERPDVDAVYMDAVQAMTGRGGWPMTVFLTPDREPFYGGTYFPKPQFLALMTAIDETYRTKPGDIRKNVDGLVKAIDKSSKIEPAADVPGIEDLNKAVQGLGRAFDPDWGGFGKPPKFPSTFNIELMLRAYMSTAADTPKTIVTTTLDAMASGGMYDHIGGGFARYSVDREWLVPHFEKMLYDQALLCKTYLHAMVVIGAPQWRQVLTETISYVLTTLRHPDGGFYSAEDADSLDENGHGVEGLFHTWTPAEARTALSSMTAAEIDEALQWFEITEAGNFSGEGNSTDEGNRPGDAGEAVAGGSEARSIPTRLHHRGQLARPPHIEAARRLLFAARCERRRPGLDDKVLTEWNALFLSTLAEAGATLNRQDWLDAAIANAEFLIRELRRPNGRWMRSWHADGDPRARHAALAADHAALVDAFTRLAEATGQSRWIDEAVRTADTMLDWFWDPENGGLYTTAEDAEVLVVRQKDLSDNATPSANSMAATALYRLAALTGEQRYHHHADRILQLMKGTLGDTVGGFTNALLAADLRRRGVTEVAIVGDRPDMVRLAHSVWRPDMVLAWGEPYESPLWEGRQDGFAYVCRDYTCQVPQDTLEGFGEALVGRPVKILTETPVGNAPPAD